VPRRDAAGAAILAVVACVPDLDLLIHSHRGESHSVGAALIAGAIAWVVTRRPRWGAAVTLAWASHVLLDWMSNDTRPPLGVMALWPLTRDYYKASFEIFPPVSRRYWESRFWIYNLRAVVAELVILGPPAIVSVASTLRWKSSRGKQTPT
jgi:membrane-bound metal-dependent hydrolase YbcI (DUF457 family)